MPYRVDITDAGRDSFDRLIELGALDVEPSPGDGVVALMPDSVTPEQVARALGLGAVAVSPAVGRDDGSIWVLSPRPVSVGRLRIVPAHFEAEPRTLRLIDAAAFGTGLHPTTALCLEALDDAVQDSPPETVLDVGTGSGVLALAALSLGVPRALAIDVDDEALRAAARNAAVNEMEGRLQLARGGPDTVSGRWPLVFANIVAAPLIEMSPALVQRVGHRGRLVLSGIATSIAPEVEQAYRHLGMRHVRVMSRAGWVALMMQATW